MSKKIRNRKLKCIALGYDLIINFRVSFIIKIPSANPNEIPQNFRGIGVVEKTRCKPGPYKFTMEANIPAGTANF